MAQLIKTLPNGTIIWNGFDIIGIKGATLDVRFEKEYATPTNNPHDFDIVVTEDNKHWLSAYHEEDDD